MAHFAEINENNIVTQVIVIHNNQLLVGEEESEENKTRIQTICNHLIN